MEIFLHRSHSGYGGCRSISSVEMNGSRLDLRHRSCSSARHVVCFSVAVPRLQSGYVGCRSISSVEVHSDYRV